MRDEHTSAGGLALLRGVLHLLDDLKKTPAGIIIHDQLTRLLADCEAQQRQVEQDYLDLLSVLLAAYSCNPSSDNVMRLTAKFLQSRPTTPISKEMIDMLSDKLRLDSYAEPEIVADKLAADKAPYFKSGTEMPPPELDKHAFAAGSEPHRDIPAREKQTQKILYGEEAASTPFTGRRVDSAYHMHLDQKRNEIGKLQEALAGKVTEAISQNKEFGALLKIERGALQQAENIQEMETLRQILLGGIDELIQGQHMLGKKLTGSKDYLQLMKSDSERLRDELHKVRLLSLTDEFTGLPNRRAFMRRLEDEIGRAQRYATPLTLIIIDLDEFKAINDSYGHAAGDDVLRCYAANVLSVFRHHDMVARYGGEEFSVLLPNTVAAGALCAITKVQNRAAKTLWEHAGNTFPLPTFSAGVTLYVPRESPRDLIDRADHALYRAKHQGRNRVEVAIVDAEKSVESEKSSS